MYIKNRILQIPPPNLTTILHLMGEFFVNTQQKLPKIKINRTFQRNIKKYLRRVCRVAYMGRASSIYKRSALLGDIFSYPIRDFSRFAQTIFPIL